MTVYTDDNGTAWYVNAVDAADLPSFLSGTVGSWLDTDLPEWNRDGAADSAYYPLTGDDEEQLEARKELLEDDTFTKGRNVRVKGRPGGLHTR